jgi:hypothetical protein
MLFGEQNALAIEAELRDLHHPEIYGSLRFWVAGVQLGDFEDSADLAASARWGRTFLAASSRRTRCDLDGVPSTEVYRLLYGRFIGDTGEAVEVMGIDDMGSWNSRPYLLNGIGDSSLRVRVVGLAVRQCDNRDRIIIRSFVADVVTETLLEPGVCDAVIQSYCTWAEGLRTFSPTPARQAPPSGRPKE